MKELLVLYFFTIESGYLGTKILMEGSLLEIQYVTNQALYSTLFMQFSFSESQTKPF